MYTNVNLEAPVGALALLGTGFLIFTTAIVLIHSLIKQRKGRARVVLISMGGITAAYLIAVLVFSFASHYWLLARGEEKHFCELDCHLAYSIVNVTQSSPSTSESNQSTRTVITIKTRFDETTISPNRGNGLLYPNSRIVTLVDDHGTRYTPTAEAGTLLTTALRPGESYTTDLIFNLPDQARPARLLINEGEWITHFVIGHENSPLHKKAEFQL